MGGYQYQMKKQKHPEKCKKQQIKEYKYQNVN